MSDEQNERADDRVEEDVEAHSIEAPHAPVGEPIGATEEPPDVEGHHMGAPVAAPVERPKDG